MLVGAVLSDQGADVRLAGSAAEAIRALSPDAGGSIPAFALTAYTRADDAERARTAGFQRYVTNPVEHDVLVAAVADLKTRP